MTSNSIKAEQNAIERRKLEEQERANKAQENIKQQDVEEKKRSNKRQEHLKHQSNVIQGVGVGTKLIGDVTGSAAKLVGKLNDPVWYKVNDGLADVVTRLPFGRAIGIATGRKYLRTKGTGKIGDAPNSFSIPGIFTMHVAQTLGPVDYLQDGQASLDSSIINIAANNLAAFIRSKTTANTSYEKNDIVMYLQAMDSVYTLFAFMHKIYATAFATNPKSRYYNKGLLFSLHVDADDIYQNLNHLQAWINIFATKINSLNVPSTLSVFKRHIWMAGSYFKDNETDYAQVFNYFFPGCYVYDEATNTLTYKENGIADSANTITVKTLVDSMNEMLNPLLNSETIAIISGDILRAFGSDLMLVGNAPDRPTFPMTYSTEILNQIRNCSCYDVDFSSLTIKQDKNQHIFQGAENKPGVLVKLTTLENGVYPELNNMLYNSYIDTPSTDDIMVGTRMSAVAKIVPDSTSDYGVAVCGTEICFKYEITTVTKLATSYSFNYVDVSSNMSLGTGNTTTPDTVSKYLKVFHDIFVNVSSFDWHPAINLYWINALDVSGRSKIYYPLAELADWNNVTLLTEDVLKPMHDAAVLSEYSVGLMGSKKTTK